MGMCPWGKCPGDTCPGGFCPVTGQIPHSRYFAFHVILHKITGLKLSCEKPALKVIHVHTT